MAARTALELADSLVYTATGRHLSDLQRTILQQVWQGKRYLDIAHRAGYTEGHIKDVAAQLWQLLSRVTGEKVTKQTLKSALERRLSILTPSSPGPIPPLPSPDLSLIGRQTAIADLNYLINQGHRAIVIQGEGGLGKTTLAQHYLNQQAADVTLELLMAQHPGDITPVEWVVEEWLRQDFGVEPGREFGVTLDRLRRQLRHCRTLVLIDNLEPSLDAQGRFVTDHRRYRELLRVLTDIHSPTLTLLTSRDRLCEPGLPLAHYRLPGLDQSAWGTYFQGRGIAATEPVLAAIHNAYGGNAKAMEILCSLVQADFEADLEAYWQIHQADLLGPVDLQNLVDSQVQRLRQLDDQAYRLFCRLGVYRFQEIPTLPHAGLTALLPDLEPSQQQAAITSLRNRSLLESRHGQYWLHPVVRQAATTQLRATRFGDIDLAHHQAARYWTESVVRITSIAEAIQALEAYYHYVAINDYSAAAQVILHSRDNQWRQFLPLGSTLYRMGLIQPVTEAITAILDHIPLHNSDASELYNILGDLYWISGRIHDAIDCQKNAIAIAQGCLQSLPTGAAAAHRLYYLTMLAVDSQLSLGLYHLDLWDLKTAAAQFHQVIDQAAGTRHQRWADKARVCLALVLSVQGVSPAAQILADRLYPQVLTADHTCRQAFFVQLLGHAYGNLGHWDKAHTLLTAALEAAAAGHYLQVKANALSGLGRHARTQGQFEKALKYHHQAIALLEEVGARCDLAEAHLQLALTLQTQGIEFGQTAVALQTAIAEFAAIPAPHQVAKVQHYGAPGLRINGQT